MLNRLLTGVGLALAMTLSAGAQGAPRSGNGTRVQAANDVPRIDTVGTYKGRLALTDSGMVFRPCRLATPYPLEYAPGTRAIVYERARWLMRRPWDELFVVLRGKLIARGGSKGKKPKPPGEAAVAAKSTGNSRLSAEFLVSRVDSIRVLHLSECAAPRPRG